MFLLFLIERDQPGVDAAVRLCRTGSVYKRYCTVVFVLIVSSETVDRCIRYVRYNLRVVTLNDDIVPMSSSHLPQLPYVDDDVSFQCTIFVEASRR